MLLDRTYMTHKLCYHPGHRIHLQRWLGFFGLLLLRFQGHSKTGLSLFVIVPSCPTLGTIRYILRHSFLFVFSTQAGIDPTNQRLAIAVP